MCSSGGFIQSVFRWPSGCECWQGPGGREFKSLVRHSTGRSARRPEYGVKRELGSRHPVGSFCVAMNDIHSVQLCTSQLIKT